MGKNVFAVPVFFIVFRETIETSIVVAILLSFIRQTLVKDPLVYKRLVKQVWLGTSAGVAICLIVGCGLIGAFYGLQKNYWSGSEGLYEGIFSLLAAIVITIMGFALLRINKMQDQWRVKIQDALASKPTDIGHGTLKNWSRRYALFLLPFITVLREGLEAVIFCGGISLAEPASAFPLPVVTGLIAGSLVGWIIYKGGNWSSLQWFLIGSTCILYLVASGLLSKAAWNFDMYQFGKLVGGDVAETGAGPGSYNIHKSVWHVNCCSPSFNGGAGWGILNSIFGWQNSATYSSVITYNVYWIFVVVWLILMRCQETHGHYPFMKGKARCSGPSMASKGPEASAGGKQGVPEAAIAEVNR